MLWTVLLFSLFVGAYLAIDAGSEKIASWMTDPLMKRAERKAGIAVKSPRTGESQVPWQHRHLGARNAFIVVSVAFGLLLLLVIWSASS